MPVGYDIGVNVNVVVFGASCVGKSEQCRVLRAMLSEWFVFETDEIKEVWKHLRDTKIAEGEDRFSPWHSDIKEMKHRRDYDRILRVALKIMDNTGQPVLCFASNPKVIEGIQGAVSKSIFLTASEDALRRRAKERCKPEELSAILRRNDELLELAEHNDSRILDTTAMSPSEVSQRVRTMIDDAHA